MCAYMLLPHFSMGSKANKLMDHAQLRLTKLTLLALLHIIILANAKPTKHASW